jgi:hypothetical protein
MPFSIPTPYRDLTTAFEICYTFHEVEKTPKHNWRASMTTLTLAEEKILRAIFGTEWDKQYTIPESPAITINGISLVTYLKQRGVVMEIDNNA